MPGSFQPPSSGGPQDPYEKYRVEQILSDREAKDSLEREESMVPQKQSVFAAYVSLMFQKFLEIFENTSELGLAISAENDVQEHLILLKTAIETLKNEDRSQDAPFLNRLSLSWHQILEDTLRFRRQSPLSNLMRSFIKELQHYPEQAQHALGYYLTEYAGQKWLPFPYMEMIHRLYLAHRKDPKISALSRWSDLLEKMIRMLSPAPKDPE